MPINEITPTPFHAHVTIESRDCDGAMTRGYTLMCEDGMSDEDFKSGVFANTISLDNPGVIEPDGEGFYYYEKTDEGFCNTHVYYCMEDDTETPNVYRDHTAEAAGY